MLSNQKKGQELLEETQELYNKLKTATEEIEKSGFRLQKDATRRFKELDAKLPEDLSTLNDSQLTSVYRQLKHISELKTSTLEGAEEGYTLFKDIEDIVENLGPKVQQKFWEAYRRLYEENADAAIRYKYDILNDITTAVENSRSKMKAIDDVERNIIHILNLVSGGRTYDEAKRMLEKGFYMGEDSEKLSDIFKHYSLDMY